MWEVSLLLRCCWGRPQPCRPGPPRLSRESCSAVRRAVFSGRIVKTELCQRRGNRHVLLPLRAKPGVVGMSLARTRRGEARVSLCRICAVVSVSPGPAQDEEHWGKLPHRRHLHPLTTAAPQRATPVGRSRELAVSHVR